MSIAKNWIGGVWVGSASVRDSIDPASGDVIGHYADAGLEDAKKSVLAARRAFINIRWSRDTDLRMRALLKLADLLETRTAELAEMTSRENGKAIAEAEFEVGVTPGGLRYSAALTQTSYGRVFDIPGKRAMVVREAAGVTAIIVPWNSPTALLVRALGPALAAGTTVVVKMPAQTAQVNYLLSRLIAKVEEIPPGVINIFTESGSDGARWITESSDVAVVSFTGSTPVGRIIGAAAAKTIKRVGLELGGKTPHIVFDDVDLSRALPVIEKSLTVFHRPVLYHGGPYPGARGDCQKAQSGVGGALSKPEGRPGPGSRQ